MILVSIQPFVFKKLLALVAIVICLSTASCFAASVFLSVKSTPYVEQILSPSPAGNVPNENNVPVSAAKNASALLHLDSGVFANLKAIGSAKDDNSAGSRLG